MNVDVEIHSVHPSTASLHFNFAFLMSGESLTNGCLYLSQGYNQNSTPPTSTSSGGTAPSYPPSSKGPSPGPRPSSGYPYPNQRPPMYPGQSAPWQNRYPGPGYSSQSGSTGSWGPHSQMNGPRQPPPPWNSGERPYGSPYGPPNASVSPHPGGWGPMKPGMRPPVYRPDMARPMGPHQRTVSSK